MIKNILTTVLILIAYFSYAQEFSKITNYQNPELRDEEIILERDSQIYRIFQNNYNEVEVWQFLGDDMNKVYTSSSSICDQGFNSWTTYKDYIIFYGAEKLRLENIFNSEIVDEQFLDIDTLDNYNKTFVHQSDGLIHILINDSPMFLYDIGHKEFVPILDGSLAYKSNNFYYYFKRINHDIDLLKRSYNSVQVDTVAKDLYIDFHTINNNKFFCQQWDGTLVMINKEDSVFRQDYNDIFINGIIPIGFNKIFAYGRDGDNNFLFTFNESNLKCEDTISTTSFISNINFGFYYFYNNKILFSTCGNTCYDRIFKIFDLETNEIIPDFGFEGGILKSPVDSLVFFSNAYSDDENIYVLNINDMSIKYVDIEPYSIRSKYSFKYKNRHYLISFEKGKGLVFLKYDFKQNFTTQTNAYINRNLGVGKKLTLIDDILYFNILYLNSINMVDETASDNIYIHQPTSAVKSNIIYYKGEFYYFQKHGFSSNRFDLIVFDPKTKETEVLLDNLKIDGGNFSIVRRKGYLLLKINSDPLIMENQYENWKVFDLENKELLVASSTQIQLLYKIFMSTKDYFYSNIGSYYNPKSYKMDKNNIDNYQEIPSVHSHSKISINEDSYSYILNNSVFYCENDNCKTIGNVIYSPYNLFTFTSPNKRYFGYVLNNSIDSVQMFIYDRIEGKSNKMNMSDFGIEGRVRISFADDDFLYLRSMSTVKKVPIFVYDFEDREISKLENISCNSRYLAVNSKEIHIWDSSNKLIKIFDKGLNEIETFSNDKIKNQLFYPSSSLNDKIRVIFLRDRSNINNRSILVYNSEKREFKSFFGCDRDQIVADIAVGDSTVYAIAKSQDSGFQIYKMDLQRNPVSTNETTTFNNNKIEVYPNPATDYLSLNHIVNGYKIYSIDGRVLLKSEAKTDKIDIRSMPEGMYFIEIKNGKQRLKFLKI